MDAHNNNSSNRREKTQKTPNATLYTERLPRLNKPGVAAISSSDRRDDHITAMSQTTHSSVTSKMNGKIREQGSTKNFSSRNSLRTAQAESKMAGTYYDNVELQKGIGDNDRYAPLHCESFLFQFNENLICILCRTIEPMQPEQSSLALDQHVQSMHHNEKFCELRCKLLNELPDESSLQMKAIHDLLSCWFEFTLTEDDIFIRNEIREEFEEILKSVSPESYCRLTGSLAHTTSLKTSNINLELVHPNSDIFRSNPRAKNSIHHDLLDPNAELGGQLNKHVMHYDLIPNALSTLHTIFEQLNSRSICLDRHSTVFQVISNLDDLSSKVPKLVLRHIRTKLILEIRPSAGSSYKLSQLIEAYMSLDSRARVLASLVKYWARLCQIDDPAVGTLPPETFAILVIFHLQRTSPPILPCIHEMLSKNFKTFNDNHHNKTRLDSGTTSHNKNTFTNNDESQQLERNDNENEDDDLVDNQDDEEDSDYNCFYIEDLSNINWYSENMTPVHVLFVDFMRVMNKEFRNLQDIITIRTLKTKETKRSSYQVKGIENPVDPKIDISRYIGSTRTFLYIKLCFEYTFYYLTSIPIDQKLKPITELRSDPKDYTELYLDVERVHNYFLMKKESILVQKPYDAVDEMIKQKLFARDVEVINALFNSYPNSQATLSKTLSRQYSKKFFAPRDISFKYCWFCRRNNHLKMQCPECRIETLHREAKTRDPSLDVRANFDSIFRRKHELDTITEGMREGFIKTLIKLNNIIETNTGLKCLLDPFGSTFNGLGGCDSDLDVCLTLKDNPTGEGVDCAAILNRVQEAIKKVQPDEPLEAILTARVPILKFRFLDIDIDLCMYNQCAIYNSHMLRCYSEIDARFPQLYYLVKRFAKACGLADASKGTLSSYAWSLMVVHYLQRTQPPILPVLQELYDGPDKPVYGVCGWNVWFNDKPRFISENTETNLTRLFKGFLLYFGTFEYRLHVISIRKLAPITRFEKNWYNCMIAIEDPFELTYNLASRLDEQMSVYIINSITKAYRHMVSLQISHVEEPHRRSILNLFERVFNGKQITGRPYPPYRGCRYCHRIGHRVAECPMK